MTTHTSNSTYRQHQLRKVAILVATLGEPLSEQLLADLPARDANEVRTLVDGLDEIDPAEYEAVVNDFRAGPAIETAASFQEPSPKMEGVELDASLLARFESGVDLEQVEQPTSYESTWRAISETEADVLIEMLAAEQPQTIAVVLARLETAQAAELITKLPPTLQVEVLTRLSDLDPADEQSLHVVESQLAEWIDAKRHQQQRMAAGYDLVRRIVDDTPKNQRTTLLTHLGKRNPILADRLSANGHMSSETTVSNLNAATTYQPPAFPAPHTTKPKVSPAAESADPLVELESLSDQQLLNSLQSVDRQTVMLALAGASESLMKRIVRGLPRRQANQFRQQVRTIGPTRLSDMIAAQRELVRCSKN